ncbi:MAG: hypothetical protein KC420_22240, partial [Myxococcales bacterium]|nr:hypothetical protein [Myxococcales bacterium]
LCEAQIAAKIETGWDDLPLPSVDVERRDRLLRRMPDPAAGAIATRPRRRPYLAWVAVGVLAIAGLAYAADALIAPPPVAVDPQLVRLEAEARDAAARVIFVYPPADNPNIRTAYQVILDLEQIGSGARGQAARDLARSLRREFAGTLAAFGDRLWDRPGGKEFAVDAYAQALLFDPDIMPAADRARLTPGQLARLADRAETRDFSKDELLASEPLAALAGGGLDAETEELEGVRERLARQVAERKASLDQLTADHATRRPPAEPAA